MKENLRLCGPFFVLLAAMTAARWIVGFRGVPYERATDLVSIVILTMTSTLYTAAFARRTNGYSVIKGAYLGFTMGFVAQLLILISTVASYAFGIESYFNHPRALNVEAAVPWTTALATRLAGLVFNSLTTGIVGALGWVLGGLLPEKKR